MPTSGFDVHNRADLTASRKRLQVQQVALGKALAAVRKMIARRDKQLKALTPTSQRARAVQFLHQRLGRHEDAGRPNRAAWLDKWANLIGSWMLGQPWCGLAVWMACRAAGLDLDKRTVSTVAIRAMAKGGLGGFKQWRPWVPGVQLDPGDVLVYGTAQSGPVHTGIYAGNGIVYEGNTSPGSGGSQNNGGGLWARKLTERHGWILGVAVPAYKH